MTKTAGFAILIGLMGFQALGDSFGTHPGYISDVEKERHTIDVEVVLDVPEEASAAESGPLVNDKLTKEFQLRFEERFGVTQMEQSMNSPGQFDEYIYYGETVSLKEYQKEQRSFGEYMARRLTEHHVDIWAKSSPSFRPVYELKDKVTNLNMQVKKGYKLKINYSLSGGHLDFRLDNPYDVDTRLRLEMAGAATPEEVMLMMSVPVGTLWTVSTMFRQRDGIVQVVGSRYLAPGLTGTITGSSDSKDEGLNQKQDLFLLGVAWTQ